MYATNHLKGNFLGGKLSRGSSSGAIILSGGATIRGAIMLGGNTIINSHITLRIVLFRL